MNKDQGSGVAERLVYSAILWLAMKGVAAGYWDGDMAAYIAAGGLALVSSAWAWWHNRPVSVLNRAGDAIPKNADLVIAPKPNATYAERVEAVQLANAASDKVVAANAPTGQR